MPTLVLLLGFAGAIAMFLWGVHMVQTGVQRAFGANLRIALRSALSNRVKAFLAGVGVTAALQSSTATGLMTAGFAAEGIIDLVPALAVMLGANVGTTLIVQLLSFDIVLASPGLILAGVVMFRSARNPMVHDLGRTLIGLGLMLLALHQLLGLVAPYESLPQWQAWIKIASGSMLVDLLAGAVLAWVLHSSVAVVVLVMSLASQGAVDPGAALVLVIGANLGTAINPVLETAGANGAPEARRVPVGNLVNRLVGLAFGVAFIGPSVALLMRIDPDPARLVANYHTLFNLVLALVFLPLLNGYARLLTLTMPERTDPADPTTPRYLDGAAREVPIVALGGAAREALRIADVLEEMLTGARQAMMKTNRRTVVETRRLDDIIDELDTAIHNYLVGLDPYMLSEQDRRRLHEILTFSANMEQAGDVIDRNLLPHCTKRMKRGLAFSDEAENELIVMIDRLIANVHAAASLFMTDDPRIARQLADEKVHFRDAVAKATEDHFMQLRPSSDQSAEASALHLDLMRDLKVINSHIVAAIAYPVLERMGELLPSRLATTEHSH